LTLGCKPEPIFVIGNTSNPTQSSSAPADTELGQTFASSSNAVIWATDVLGEFEINNKEPITKIGSGLHPKVKQEKGLATDQLNSSVSAGALDDWVGLLVLPCV
jgi:hypothetical protein